MSDLRTSNQHNSIEDGWCLRCQQRAIVLVDVETETVPLTDCYGHWLYYCPTCQHTFVTHTYKSQPSESHINCG